VAGTLDGAAANVAGNAVAVGFLAGKPVDAVVSSDMRAECVVHTGTALLVAGTALMLAAGTVLLVAAGTALLAAGNALLLAAGNALLLVAGTARAADGVLLLVAAAAVGTSLLLAAAAVAALLAASDSSGTAWLPAGAGGKAAAAGRCALGYFLPQQIPLRQSQTSVSDETIFYCRWK